VYGDIVVWTDLRNGNRDIYGYDLVTQEEFCITADESDQQNPKIYEQTVIWEDNRDGSSSIYGYDLVTQEEFCITADDSDQWFLAIYKDVVVWTDDKNDTYDICGLNLRELRKESLLHEADSLLEKGKEAFDKETYETALSYFLQAQQKYEEAESSTGEVEPWILKTQKEIEKEAAMAEAEVLVEKGKKAFEEEDYEAALDFFQQAKETYETAGSERVTECNEWIQRVQHEMELQEITPIDDERDHIDMHFSWVIIIAVGVLAVIPTAYYLISHKRTRNRE
jgi:beta propeller repeat protein